jgi:hypothetical protein
MKRVGKEPPIRAPAKRKRSRREIGAQDASDLPKREALSLLGGIPALPGVPALPTDLLSGGAGAPSSAVQDAPIDQTTGLVPPDATTSQPNVQQDAPVNQATADNLQSSGTFEQASASQDAPRR